MIMMGIMAFGTEEMQDNYFKDKCYYCGSRENLRPMGDFEYICDECWEDNNDGKRFKK